MNALIGMIADFLDHLADPAFGRQTNESYSLRAGILLDGDERLAEQLANVELSPDDVPSLSLSSWLWYLRWRTLRGGQVPGDAFLTELYDATNEPIVRLRVVETVIARVRADQDTRERERPGLADLPDNWLRHRMYSILDQREIPGATPAEQIWELCVYLLQLGDDASLAVLRALLAEQWGGRPDLVARIQDVLARPGLEQEAVGQLRRRLGLDEAGA